MSIVRYLAGMAAVMLILLPLWALARLLFLHLQGRRAAADWRHEVLLAVFVLYLAALASQTILPRIGWADGMLTIQRWNGGPPNYKPFYMIRLMLFRAKDPVYRAVNLLGNVAIFLPLGVLPPLLWPRWRKGCAILLGMGVSIFIELVQPLVGRTRDVDDLILNTLGALLGWLIVLLVQTVRRHKRKKT